jgi:putative transposase
MSGEVFRFMPRPLRFEFPGAIYHVINRGNYRSWIFEDDGAKRSFESCLHEACERSGWVLHAYCVMDNHYHLALETPEPNLSEGMRWLQGVYATRYNRYRKERGHLFQGRFKSIVIEDFERLSWLCHYIHLNPVRAGVVDVETLGDYEFGSYRYLQRKRGRPEKLDLDVCLDGAGGLKDAPAGRRKYAEYLKWLSEDEPRRKAMNFDRMSRGWAHGAKSFKKELVKDAEKERAHIALGGTSSREASELAWELVLDECLEVLGKTKADALEDRKFASWKVSICAYLKSRFLCRNTWLSEHLKMGVDSGVSRYVTLLRPGEDEPGAKLLKRLRARIKYRPF